MKAIKVILAGLFTCTLLAFTTSSVDKVPQKVKDAFVQKFPEAKSVKWDKESQNEWEAEFKMDGMDYSANFSNDGAWKETEHEVRQADVPQIVMVALKKEFPGYKIRESEISENSEGMVYEFEIKKGGSQMEVALDPNGKVTSKKENDGEDED